MGLLKPDHISMFWTIICFFYKINTVLLIREKWRVMLDRYEPELLNVDTPSTKFNQNPFCNLGYEACEQADEHPSLPHEFLAQNM
jgi:hypothetical protein